MLGFIATSLHSSLKDKGVDLVTTNLSEEGKKAVEDAKAKILDGSVKVPEK